MIDHGISDFCDSKLILLAKKDKSSYLGSFGEKYIQAMYTLQRYKDFTYDASTIYISRPRSCANQLPLTQEVFLM